MFRADQNPAELGRRGAAARNQNLCPLERSAIASSAAYQRWHGRIGEDLARVQLMLRALEQIATSAREEGNDKQLKQATSLMSKYERFRIHYQQMSRSERT